MLCEVQCGVDRSAGVRGACGLAESTPVYRRLIHLGEELPLVPSYAVWLAGCNFACSFCSDDHALRPPLPGEHLSATELADRIAADLTASTRQVRNINFVGGEPGISLPFIADVATALAERVERLPPLLLNTNGFLTTAALECAIELFEIFVVDWKFGNDECARQIGTPADYSAILERNLRLLEDSGRSVWVRHLLMPGHIDCCTHPVLARLETHSEEIHVNVMPAFVAFDRRWSSLKAEEIASARAAYQKAAIGSRYWDGRPLT
jgi:putative pyruvate formate lyase activating enzyme